VSVLEARLQPPFLLIEPLGAQQPGQEITVGRRSRAGGGQFTLDDLGYLVQAEILQELLNLLSHRRLRPAGQG
jgi:hypothetical protein